MSAAVDPLDGPRWSLQAKRCSVRGGCDAEGAVEVPAQGGGGPHAAAGRDLVDGGVGSFEELLGAGDPLLVEPVERSSLELRLHPSGELAGAEVGAGRFPGSTPGRWRRRRSHGNRVRLR